MIDLIPANCPVEGVTTSLMKSINQSVRWSVETHSIFYYFFRRGDKSMIYDY